MDEKKAIRIFQCWFDPYLYTNRNELKSELKRAWPEGTLNELKVFLEQVIADPTISSEEKLRKYFRNPTDDKEYADRFLKNNLEDLKEITESK